MAEERDGAGMIERPFSISQEDGTVIQGEVRLPEGEPPSSAVVVAHGFKGFKDWGFFPHLSESLAREGHAAVSFNFTLNGIGDDPTEFTELENFARNTFSRDVDEILAVLAEVRGAGILPVPPTRLGLLGHSRGGGEAVVAARDDGRLDALVTWAAVANFDRWSPETIAEWRTEGRIHVLNSRTGQQMPLDLSLLDDFEQNRDRLDVEAAAASLRSLPWLIVHGDLDTSVPISEARRLAAADPDATLTIVPEAGHAFEAAHPFEGTTPELEAAILATTDHFRSHLLAEGERAGS